MIVWKDIPNHSGFQASDDGQIRSLTRTVYVGNGRTRTQVGRTLSQITAGQDYRVVCIGGNRKEYVHRLVAMAFIGDIPKGILVDHINRVHTDNHARNLRLITRAGNRWNSVAHKGVCLDADGKWRAYITRGKAFITLGRFHSEAEARATREAARERALMEEVV